MSPTGRMVGRLVPLLVLAAAGPAAAQDPPPPPDTTQVAVPDTAAVPDTVDLAAEARAGMPAEVPPGPLPPLSRIVFSRDSLDWLGAYTLADLLAHVPGVYVARTGFLNQPHPAFTAGRGPDGLEFFWDGIPLLPVGPDSLAVDPARISLFGLERVEIEPRAGGMRVWLVTARHAEAVSRSRVRIASGDVRTAGYAGLFQHQWANGLALNLRGDFFSTEGVREAPRNDRYFDLAARVDWTPTPRVGASWQIRSNQYQRDGIGGEAGGVTDPRNGRRSDAVFRFAASQRAHRMGAGLEAGVMSTTWHDSLTRNRTLRQAFLTLGWRGYRTLAQVTGRVADGFYERGADARLGWAPWDWAALAADGRIRAYPGGRTARRGRGTLGFRLGPLALTAEAASGDLLATPLLPDDTVQTTRDYGARAGIDLGRVAAFGGILHRGAYTPHAPNGIPVVAALRTTPEGDWYTAEVRLQPWRELTLDAWYANPRETLADFQPPEHGRAAITFASDFFRAFRSGAWDLKIRYGIEYWSTWTAGVDENGADIVVPGATFHELFIQFRIVGFRAFYRLENARNSRGRYAPDLDYPRALQSFGVHWDFRN